MAKNPGSTTPMGVIGAVNGKKSRFHYANGGYWSSGAIKKRVRLRQWGLLEQWSDKKAGSTTPMRVIGAVETEKNTVDFTNKGC